MRPYWILVAVALAAMLTLPVAVLVFVSAPISSQETRAPRVVLSVASDKESYLPGEAVFIAIRVANEGNSVAMLSFSSTCQASYSVLATDGSLIFDYRGKVFCGPMLTNLTLRPGDARVFGFAWTQITDSGLPAIPFRSYRIHGVLLSTNPSPAPSAETTIFVSGETSRPSLAFTARTDRATYLPGESANVTVILTNIGLDTIVMHFGQPCYVQFLVLDEARHAVYNSSKWWGCVQLLTDEILAPGQSRSETFLWNLRTDAGSPLALGSQYEVVPSFLWAYMDPYQRYVSRTDVATFTVAAFTG